MELVEIRPKDYVTARKSRSLEEAVQNTQATLKAAFRARNRAYAEDKRLHLILGPEDFIEGQHPLRTSSYRTGGLLMLYLAHKVTIVLDDGRRWVHKSHAGPQQTFEEAA